MNEMKFALKIRNFCISSITAVLTVLSANAQQFSYEKNKQIFSINRYTFPFHLGIEKTYSISQNNSGIIFFSTNKGIITFDGQDWGVVNFHRKSFLKLCSGNLYLFSRNYTGQILKEVSGSYSLKEIPTEHPTDDWSPEDVICSGDSVLILSNQKLWLLLNNTFIPLDTIAHGQFQSKAGGIFIKSNNKFLKLTHGKLIPAKETMENGSFQPFLSENFIFPDLTDTLSKESALEKSFLPFKDEIVTSYSDKNNNLWVLSRNALYCIINANYFRFLSRIPSISKPLKFIAKDSTSYFLADKTTLVSTSGSALKSTVGSIHYVYSMGENNITIAGEKGIFKLRNQKPEQLVSRPVSYAVGNKDKLLFVSKGILYSLRNNNENTAVKELFRLKTDSITKIIIRNDRNLVVLDKFNRIHLLKSGNTGYTMETLYQGSDNTPPLDNIFQIHNEVYVCNAFNIYKLEGSNLVSQEKSKLNFPSQGHFIEYLEEDTMGGILYSTGKPGESKHVYYGKSSGGTQLNWLEVPIWEAGLKNPDILSCSGREVLFFENGNLIHLNLDKFFGRPDKVIITVSEINAGNQPIALENRKRSNEVYPYFEARYPANLISLKFHACDLTYPDHLRYSFLLKDKDADWSPWERLAEKNFSNLPPGDYTLLAKAQTLNGTISDTYTLRFRIHPPIYLQWYAWVVYSLFISGIIGMLGFRRKKQFESEKIKLERIIQERTSELTREKEKTDELLANMLPKDTADELKSTGKATSHKFDLVTVLFSDIQGFTKIAEQMNPEKLIDELDNFFFQFDSVVEKYNIEKIKTIGDAYMAAGGIPYKNRTNPVEVVLAALEMQEYMKTLKVKNTDIWDLRIGIHTGAVIAGVVGHKRISYDIWGDTVNTASRMESSGEASKINISGHTYELVKDFFICEYRGKMPVKYKGDIDMYFVKGIRPELSVNLRTIPNKKFFVQLQLLRILDLEEFVFNKLESELPMQLPFHNLKHTKDVYTQAELLGRAENINSEEMLILRTAALLHDIGFIWSYNEHELKSIEFCRDILPKFKYSADQIDTICNLIQCTKKGTLPKTKLEEILIDANTDFFGRIDFVPMLVNLIQELKIYYNKSNEDWIMDFINQLEKHEYYTLTARKLCEVPKHEQIGKLREHIKQFQA
jgi:class 3 adenylate cyclase